MAMDTSEAIEYLEQMKAYNSEEARKYEPDFMQERMEKAHDVAEIAIAALTEKRDKEMLEEHKNRFKEGQLVVYKHPGLNECEIGKIKRLCDDGAFVWYHTGETAAKTRYEDMMPIINKQYVSGEHLGGEAGKNWGREP